MVRKWVVIVSVVAAVAVASGLGSLIWWLVTREDDVPDTTDAPGTTDYPGTTDAPDPPRFQTIPLRGEGFGDVDHKAAFARIPDTGDMFWWFYPTLASQAPTRPLVLWLDGVIGLPPSVHANFGMFGPFDFNLDRRDNSWIDEYNLLFVDAPLGSGFSSAFAKDNIPVNVATNTEHLLLTLESFYSENEEFTDAPLYIFGQGYGAQLAMSLALSLRNSTFISPNLKGVVMSNAIISPALALTKLGFYLEELGYIDDKGRISTEDYTRKINELVNNGEMASASEHFLSLGDFINKNAGTIAVNLRNIIDKLSNSASTDVFGQAKHLKDAVGSDVDINKFMNEVVATALGISDPAYDASREDVLNAFKAQLIVPATSTVEEILDTTDLNITILNGNLDAVSNPPGQLEWVNNLKWSGQQEFLSNTRNTLIVNRLIEGYFRESDRLTFYWMSATGYSIPLDSPVAMRRVLQRIMDE